MQFSRYPPSTQVYEAESNIDNFDVQRSWGWEPTGTLEQMRKELRVSIESTVEKSVMDMQIHKSKVGALFVAKIVSLSCAASVAIFDLVCTAGPTTAGRMLSGWHALGETVEWCERWMSFEACERLWECFLHLDRCLASQPFFQRVPFLGVRSTIWHFVVRPLCYCPL